MYMHFVRSGILYKEFFCRGHTHASYMMRHISGSLLLALVSLLIHSECVHLCVLYKDIKLLLL